VRQHKRELTAAAATGDDVLRRSDEERAAACQQHTALAAAHSKLAMQLDAAKRARDLELPMRNQRAETVLEPNKRSHAMA